MADKEYMFIRKINKKVPLIAHDNILTLNFNGDVHKLGISIERMFVYYIYNDNDRKPIIKWLREFCGVNSTEYIDDFFERFIKTHPLITCEPWTVNDYWKLIETQGEVVLPLPGTSLEIPRNFNKTLLNRAILPDASSLSTLSLKMSFMEYLDKYVIDLGLGDDTYELLGRAYCMQYGFDYGFAPQSVEKQVTKWRLKWAIGIFSAACLLRFTFLHIMADTCIGELLSFSGGLIIIIMLVYWETVLLHKLIKRRQKKQKSKNTTQLRYIPNDKIKK